jgi:hypothetical protein
MFCSECGKPAQGKFCSYCGARLAATEVIANAVPTESGLKWEHEVEYETILRYPGVRDKIERHARQAPVRLTGEQFLMLADKLVPLGVPLEDLVSVVQPLYSRLGIKTGKERAGQVPAPVGEVIVRALCSLARRGQTLRGVTQAVDGCVLEAALPSDLFSLNGDLLVSVRRSGTEAEVRGATRIGGQFYDWGKSKRCLDTLFADLTREVA